MPRKLTGGVLRIATRVFQSAKGNRQQAISDLLAEIPGLSYSRAEKAISEASQSITAAQKLSKLKPGRVLQQSDIPIAARVAGHEGTSLKYQYRIEIDDLEASRRNRRRVIYVDSVRLLSADEVYQRAARNAPNQPQYVNGVGWVEVNTSDSAVYTIASIARSR